MIAVSNEFKKTIKSDERRIKGYVEVLYDVEDVNVSVTSNMTSSYTELSDITQGGRVKQNYGTLDYLPLDGSCLTMDTSNNEDSGFISNDLSGAETGRTFTLNFSSTTLNGITIYYKNNLPDGTYLTFSDGTTGYIEAPEDTGNEIYMQQYIFDTPKTLTSITIEYNLWRYETRKVKIPRIDLGVSAVYKDQDLIEFTVDEEVNKLVEEVPTNETNVTLNNIYDLFNPLNPQGVVKYLSDGSKIIPHIGVLTETQGVEFVKMGEFFFDSYTNNSDKTTTLVGKNIIKQLEAKEITNGLIQTQHNNYFLDRVVDEYNNTFKGLIENSGQPIIIQLSSIIPTYIIHIKDVNMVELIKQWCLLQNALFLGNRNNDLTIKNINFNTVDTLTKNELLEDVSFKYIDKINTMRIKKERKENNDTYGGEYQTTYKMFDNYQLPLTESPQIFIIEKPNSHFMTNFVNTFSNGTGEILWDNQNFVIIRVTGTIGNTATLTSSWTSYYSSRGSNITTIDEGTFSTKTSGEKEVVVEISDQIGFGTRTTNFKNILNYAPSYEISFEYNGDPSLEAGDYINVETPYGYKPVFIQKNTFKFNGGLSGSIEGVE